MSKGDTFGDKALSLCLDLYTESMASFASSLSEADRMAQGACDAMARGTTGPDYVRPREASSVRAQTAPDTLQWTQSACTL